MKPPSGLASCGLRYCTSTLAGSGTQGKTDGTGAAASFAQPAGIAVDVSGNVYVGDYGNAVIRKITPAAP